MSGKKADSSGVLEKNAVRGFTFATSPPSSDGRAINTGLTVAPQY